MSATWHGTAGGYVNHNCRCEGCTAAATDAQRRRRLTRTTRLAAGEVTVQHGTQSTYTNWGCRCEACTAAMTAANRIRRAAKR